MASGTQKPIGDQLLAALKKIDRPGNFCASGAATMVLPGLEVAGVGTVSLPLQTGQAAELKKSCEQAGYGRGEETVVDTDVRRVWKLKPEQFSLTNPAWPTAIDDIVSRVQRELGLEQQELRPHLYDLLLYEKGSFFLPHRDGEKLDRMVATLIILLPSSYTGGELLIRHEGREQAVDFSGNAGRFQIHYAAFYADCEHEVKPLLSGFRLCLVYNLTLAKSKGSIAAPKAEEHISTISKIMRDWSDQSAAPDKMAVALTHQYTKDGLAWDALKGVDRSVALALAEAARRSQCHAYLALATLWESGSIAHDGEHESGYRRRRSHRGREHTGGRVMEEMFDSSLTAERLRSLDGESMPLESLTIQPAEIVPEGYLKTLDPEEDVHGYTGNEGLTLDRWYRQAVIMLWPDSRHFDVLCDDDSRNAIPLLKKMVAALRKSGSVDSADVLERARAFAREILDRWPKCEYRPWFSEVPVSHDRDPISALLHLNDASLIHLYLRNVLAQDVSLEPRADLVKAITLHGWRVMQPDLRVVFKRTTTEFVDRNARLLEQLSLTAAKRKASKDGDEVHQVCRATAGDLLAALVRVDTPDAADHYRWRPVDRGKLVACMVRCLLLIDLPDELSRLITHVREQTRLYPLHAVQLPAISELADWSLATPQQDFAPLAKWAACCIAELESLTAHAPEPPKDYQREASVNCNCKHCSELNRFLRDPQAPEYRFQLAQQHRDHLENSIRRHACDLTRTTDKRPRPQVLICTKNIQSFEANLKTYNENLQHLARLRAFARKVSRATNKC